MRFWAAALITLVVAGSAAERKLSPEDRIELIRGLTAEYATVKTFLPRSKKALAVTNNGAFDKKEWEAVGREHGPAARAGDLVLISKIQIEDDRIVFEINGGFKGGRKWYQRVQVGVGGRTGPVMGGPQTAAPGGTSLALMLGKPLPPLKPAEVKKMLAPVLDFEKRSVTEHYVESLPPAIKQAVQEKRAVEGMDRDQVVLALGRPVRKVRETVDGQELEDWVYGTPPGRIVFVTFEGNKVVRVKESYAGLGTEAPPLKTPR
ncbi:MAG: hypothetical protein AAB225_15995 [Acidobacteriota bacterium]